MANRVLLGEFQNDFVLRASMPGFDVLNPYLNEQQLVFDSRWSKISSIYMDTWVYVPINQPQTLWFGKWFDPLPTVLLMWHPDYNSHNLSSATFWHTTYNSNWIYNDHIEFNGQFERNDAHNGWYRVLVMTD